MTEIGPVCGAGKATVDPRDEIAVCARFLRNASPGTEPSLLHEALERLVHLQFRYREERGYGLIVTEDEYWAIRNVVWNIDKRIFWHAIGKRLLHLYHEGMWVLFNDRTEAWEAFDALSFKKTRLDVPPSWAPWAKVLNDDAPPQFRWFDGAKTNLSFNGLDRHILNDPQPGFHRCWESESWGQPEPEERLRLTHREVLFEVTKVVMGLKRLGILPDDRVAILMPEIPQAYYLIEAFHRLGILYTSLPTSLGDQQVSDRIENLGVSYLFTVNGGWHKGKPVYYKEDLLDKGLEGYQDKSHVFDMLDEFHDLITEDQRQALSVRVNARFENRLTLHKDDFLRLCNDLGLSTDFLDAVSRKFSGERDRVKKVVVYQRLQGHKTGMKAVRDLDWGEFVGKGSEAAILAKASEMIGRPIAREEFLDYATLSPEHFLKVVHHFARPTVVEANHPRLVIYTSGSTGLPKGVVHSTLGHAVFGTYTMMVTMGPRPGEIMDTRATHSWITGLDYIAGMPGMLGIESIVAEGAFDYERWLRRLSRMKVQIAKAGAPVLRGVKDFVESRRGRRIVAELDFRHLRICVNCAEPADPVTQHTIDKLFGAETYVNTWWPTELTGPNTGAGSRTVPFAYPMKRDGSTYPLPYVKQEVMDEAVDADDQVLNARPQKDGSLGRYVIDPHPGMLATLYGDPEKFRDAYFMRYWSDEGRETWYDTGDGAIRHEDGSLHVVGRVGYAFNWNGHISGAEDVEGVLRDHPAVKDVMIAPIKSGNQSLDQLQVFLVLNQGYVLDGGLKTEFDDLVVRKKQRTFKGLMTEGADYFPVETYPVTMSQKSLRRFGAMLGSLTREQLASILKALENPTLRAEVEAGNETLIHTVFPSRKEQNPYAGSLVGLGNYPSLVHLTYAVAKAKGIELNERS